MDRVHDPFVLEYVPNFVDVAFVEDVVNLEKNSPQKKQIQSNDKTETDREKFFFVFAPRIRCELYCNSKFFPHCEHYDDAKSSYVDTEMFSLDFSQVLRSQLILDLCYPLLVIPNCCIFIMYFHLSGL